MLAEGRDGVTRSCARQKVTEPPLSSVDHMLQLARIQANLGTVIYVGGRRPQALHVIRLPYVPGWGGISHGRESISHGRL